MGYMNFHMTHCQNILLHKREADTWVVSAFVADLSPAMVFNVLRSFA